MADKVSDKFEKTDDDSCDRKKVFLPRSCTNCSKIGHDYKHCREPTTSWGIIAIKHQFLSKLNVLHCDNNLQTANGIAIKSKSDLKSIGKYMDSIRFLMVSRKHSLGYVEFIRGRYKPDNIEGIIFMFQQMMQHEIIRIGKSTFNELWDEFWASDVKKQFYKKEYVESKTKFDQLRDKNGVELGLDFYINNVKAQYDTAEWGFPKGRKSRGESDIDCAVREFCEETGYTLDDIKILTDIKPIVENITGTNGIKYRHIYYLAEMTTNTDPRVNKTDQVQSSEIGDIGFFTHREANSLIREYHIEKKNILTNIFMYYMEIILHYTSAVKSTNSQYHENWVVESADIIPE